jgi:hypothetical protein
VLGEDVIIDYYLDEHVGVRIGLVRQADLGGKSIILAIELPDRARAITVAVKAGVECSFVVLDIDSLGP